MAGTAERSRQVPGILKFDDDFRATTSMQWSSRADPFRTVKFAGAIRSTVDMKTTTGVCA